METVQVTASGTKDTHRIRPKSDAALRHRRPISQPLTALLNVMESHSHSQIRIATKRTMANSH